MAAIVFQLRVVAGALKQSIELRQITDRLHLAPTDAEHDATLLPGDLQFSLSSRRHAVRKA